KSNVRSTGIIEDFTWNSYDKKRNDTTNHLIRLE
uniref:Transposase n=1 Tax=Strongyloides venezuelensis TaxID=75913 RepID=A0A0K0FT56_STRVS